MKHLWLLLLLLPSQLLAQTNLPHFLDRPMSEVGKMLAAKHLAFDTSFRFPPEGPTVDYIAYAPYKIGNIPGVLLLRGRNSVTVVRWYSRGVDVDSDLNWVIGRKPNGPFANEVAKIGKPIFPRSKFNSLVKHLSRTLGTPKHQDSTHASWSSGCSLSAKHGFVSYQEMKLLTPRTFQPIVYDSAKSAAIRARLSPGFRGQTRAEIDRKVNGQYEVRQVSLDSTTIQYSPFRFHGLAGVLAVSFDKAGRCRSIYWSSHDPDWLISHSRDTALPLYHSLRALEPNRVTEEQYNALREEIGLERLKQPNGPSFLEYWPLLQELRYEHGMLQYTEAPSLFPPQHDTYLVGAEPTMDVSTGH